MEKVGFPRTVRDADTKKERVGAEQAESRGIPSVVGRLPLTMDDMEWTPRTQRSPAAPAPGQLLEPFPGPVSADSSNLSSPRTSALTVGRSCSLL